MIAQSPWRRDAELIAKQERIDHELDRFRDEARPDLAALPREIAEILRFVHNHLFDSALNVAAARRSCGLRNNNVSTAFRVAVGVGLREYIETLRLRAAERLLRDGGLEVYLVAMAVGYDHLETFCRAFQRRFGYTSSHHRKAEMAGEAVAAAQKEIQAYLQEAASL
ncbi:MAG: helix-turn-helix transcriptional regulator [Thermoanaerobaculia bacterium]